MYKCECGCEFDEPKYNREYHGLEYGYEEIAVCPRCGGTDIDEGKPCKTCGEETFNDHYCDNCMGDAKAMLRSDFKYFKAPISELVDLFNYALDEIYVEDRNEHQIQRPVAG